MDTLEDVNVWNKSLCPLCPKGPPTSSFTDLFVLPLRDFPFQVLMNQSSHSSPSMKLYIFQPQLISVSMKSGWAGTLPEALCFGKISSQHLDWAVVHSRPFVACMNIFSQPTPKPSLAFFLFCRLVIRNSPQRPEDWGGGCHGTMSHLCK